MLDVWSCGTIKARIFVFSGKEQDTWMLDVCSKACGNFLFLFVFAQRQKGAQTPCARCVTLE